MTTLTRMVTHQEAMALRACARTYTGKLDSFMPVQHRIGLGTRDGTSFKLVVSIGDGRAFGMADVERYKMGLWSRVWFKIGPHCRVCGERLTHGEKALCFSFNPDGKDDEYRDHWRKAFIHAEDCA